MHMFFAASLLITAVLALPTPEVQSLLKSKTEAFTLPVHRRDEVATPEVLSKPKTKSFKLPVHRRDEAAVVAHDLGPVWEVLISVGGQELRMLADTGSADLWVPSAELPEEQKGSHQLYDASTSSTAVKIDGELFDINYSFLGASGYVVTEDVKIGDIVAQGILVGVATNIGPYLVDQTGYDGILGLAFKSGNSMRPNQSPTLMEYIQNQLDAPVFTANLRAGNKDGTLEFGYVDESLYCGTLHTVSIDNSTDGSWTVDQVLMTVGDVQVIQPMLFDTGGANFMTVSPAIADAYWAQVKGAIKTTADDGKTSYWGAPCDANLPDFSLQIGDGTAVIPGLLLNAGLLSDAAALPLCTGALQAQNPTSSSGSVGAPFFEAYFTVFNQADPSIGYAPHAD